MKVRVLTSIALSLFLLEGVLAKNTSRGVAAPASYRLIKKITLGGEGGWDYLTLDPQ